MRRVDRFRLVVGVDGSAAAREALRWGSRFATVLGGEIVVAHALRPFGADEAVDTGDPALAEKRRATLAEVVESEWCVALRGEGPPFEVVVRESDPVELLVGLATAATEDEGDGDAEADAGRPGPVGLANPTTEDQDGAGADGRSPGSVGLATAATDDEGEAETDGGSPGPVGLAGTPERVDRGGDGVAGQDVPDEDCGPGDPDGGSQHGPEARPLVVLGNCGLGESERLDLGGTCRGVLAARRLPALVVTRRDRAAAHLALRRIVVGIDDRPAADAALAMACAVAKGFRSWVHVVHAADEGDERAATRAEVLRRRVAGLGLPVHVSVERGDPAEVIRGAVARLDADLVVVGSNERGAGPHAVHPSAPSVSRQVVRSVQRPTLVVPDGEASARALRELGDGS